MSILPSFEARRAAFGAIGNTQSAAVDPSVAAMSQRAQEFMQTAWVTSQSLGSPPPQGSEKQQATQTTETQASISPGLGVRGGSTGAVQHPSELSDRELLARTIQLEAGSQGEKGMLAVGSVIANRTRAKGWGNDLKSVILQPGQFSPFNGVTGYANGEQGSNGWMQPATAAAYQIADSVIAGGYSDPTGGATHFVNEQISQPSWRKNLSAHGQIGDHTFYGPGLSRYGQ